MLPGSKDEVGYELRVANIWRRFFEESGFSFLFGICFLQCLVRLYRRGARTVPKKT